MALLDETLLEIDAELVRSAGGSAIRAWAHPQAVFVLPGFVFDREEYAAALDVAEGWDRTEVEPLRVVPMGSGAAAVVTRFTGLRGDHVYRAEIVSTYVDTVEGPRLMTHQHTMEWVPDVA